MKKTKMFRIFLCTLLSLSMCTYLILPLSGTAEKKTETVHIKNEEDLRELARNCSLDTWSLNKTVELDADIEIDNSKVQFLPVPIFCGTFNGNGHTISGFRISENIVESGFFGTIHKNAVIKELNITADISPSKDAKIIGGIAGINYGTILNCNFSGNVSGETSIGGIAGLNESTGRIIGCSYEGRLTAQHYTGGIAGQNMGSIIKCENRGEINTTAAEADNDLSSLNIDSLNSAENMPASTDIGGIAGLSTGRIADCINNGNVGYEHMGYNVGGIAGRQSGYLGKCENNGTVKGRKDIGGIAGQMEPMVILKYQEDVLDQLWEELDTLQDMVEETLNSSDNASASLSSNMKDIISDIREIKNNIKDLSGAYKDWGNDNIGHLNDISEELSWIVSQMDPILGNLSDSMKYADEAADLLTEAVDNAHAAGEIGEEAAKEVRLAANELKVSLSHFQAALIELDDALTLLGNSLGDDGEIKKALDKLNTSLKSLKTSFGEVQAANEKIISSIKNIENFPGGEQAKDELITAFTSLGNAINNMLKTLEGIIDSVTELEKNGVTLLDNVTKKLGSSIKHMISCIDYLSKAGEHFSKAADYMEEAEPYADSSIQLFIDTVKTAQKSISSLNDAVNKLKEIVETLTETPPIRFSPVGNDITEKGQELDKSISKLLDDMSVLEKNISSSSSELVEELSAINKQSGIITDLLELGLDDAKNQESSDYFEDISDKKISKSSAGQITNSKNNGSVEGDMNTAGVVGSLSIEYDFDPEDDLTKDGGRTLNFSYETLAVVTECINEGSILAKKNYAGGISGRMDLGSIKKCENFGKIESTEGCYIGGITGYTSSAIKDCYVKCSLKGDRYVGGITGDGDGSNKISGCYTLVEINNAKQYSGAVSGTENGKFSDNYFVSDELAGLGRISLAKKAEPISYDELVKIEYIPENMTRFTLRFIADDTEVMSQSFNYGDSFENNSFPEIPEKEGYYAYWDTDELKDMHFDKTVNAVYSRYVLSLTSEDTRDGNKCIFLVDGNFDRDSSLDTSNDAPELPDYIEQWRLTFSADGQNTHTIRYLPPDKKTGEYDIYVKTDSTWKKVPTETFGSYIIFKADGTTVNVGIKKAGFNRLILLSVTGASLLFILIIFIHHKMKKKNRQKKPQPLKT